MLADSPAEQPSELPAGAEFEPVPLPDSQDVTEGIESAELEEEVREQELESPKAEREREESRDAFTDLSSATAKELLLTAFPEQLEALNDDDGEAINVDPSLTSIYVLTNQSHGQFMVHSLERARVGMTLCWSGIYGGYQCGAAKRWFRKRYGGHFTRELEIFAGSAEGDSGSPVWNRETKNAVGLATYHHGHGDECYSLSSGPIYCKKTGITPLLPRESVSNPAGILIELSVGLEMN